jgi:glutamate dehydrogenase (NADP+)
MAQNSQRISWTSEEVDGKLKDIMKAAFDNGIKNAKQYVPAKEGELPSLVAGSNIAGFVKVVVSVSILVIKRNKYADQSALQEAMHDQGDWW